MSNNHDRRSFLKKCAGLTAVAAASGMFSTRTVAGPSGKDKEKERWLSIGKLTDLVDSKINRIEKAVQILDGKIVKKPKLIAVRRGDQVYVMSTQCTHFGCEVNLREDRSYICPCHKSVFDRNGAVTHGPAKRPLSWYEAIITKEGDIRVNVNKTIEAPNLE